MLKKSVDRTRNGAHIFVIPIHVPSLISEASLCSSSSQSPWVLSSVSQTYWFLLLCQLTSSSKAPNKHANLGSDVTCEATFVVSAVLLFIQTTSPIPQVSSSLSFPFIMEELLTNSRCEPTWVGPRCQRHTLVCDRQPQWPLMRIKINVSWDQGLLTEGPSMCEFLWTERPWLQLSSYSQGYL